MYATHVLLRVLYYWPSILSLLERSLFTRMVRAHLCTFTIRIERGV